MINKVVSGKAFLSAVKKDFSGLPTIPTYKHDVSEIGEWKVTPFDLGKSNLGYYTSASDIGHGTALLKNGTPWMSCTPMEIESHVIAQHAAKGVTVVAGLGLIAMSLLAKPKVKKLIVLEIDVDLINAFSSLLDGESKKLWGKSIDSGRLEIINADCKAELSHEVLSKVRGADYLWVDIWEILGFEGALEVTNNLHKQIQSKAVDYWGQEIDLVIEMGRISDPADSRARKFSKFSDLVKGHELPLSASSMNRKLLDTYFELTLLAGANFLHATKQKQEAKKTASASLKKKFTPSSVEQL